MGIEDLLAYWSIIRRKFWLILLLFISTVGTIVGASYLSPPVYLATVRFEVTAPPPVDVTLFTGFGNYDPAEEIVRTRDSFIDVLTGRSVAREVIETLQLQMEPEDLQSQIIIEKVELPQLGAEAGQSDRQLMRVGVRSSDPELAADLTNTLINAALQRYGQIRARPKTMSRDFITSQLEITQTELHQARESLINFQIENTIGDLPQAVSLHQDLIADLRRMRDIAQAEGRVVEAVGFDDLLAEREVELQDMVGLELEYAALQARVDQAQSTYEFLLQKQTEASLKENEILTLGFIQVIGVADPPSSPLPQVRMSILALGAVLSLIVGLMIAFISHYLEVRRLESVKSADRGDLSTVSPVS